MSDAPTPGGDDARAIERIEQALTTLGAEHVPPDGWESGVIAARAARAQRPSRAWLRWAAPALALVAALVLVWWVRRDRERPSQLAMVISRGDDLMRDASKESVHLGDTVHLAARGGRQRALWVYLNRQLLLACPGDASCQPGDGELRAALPARALGSYTVVAVFSAMPIPAPAGSRDADLGAAMEAGASHEEKAFEIR